MLPFEGCACILVNLSVTMLCKTWWLCFGDLNCVMDDVATSMLSSISSVLVATLLCVIPIAIYESLYWVCLILRRAQNVKVCI